MRYRFMLLYISGMKRFTFRTAAVLGLVEFRRLITFGW